MENPEKLTVLQFAARLLTAAPSVSKEDAYRLGFRSAVEMLRTDQARAKCLNETKGIGSFVSHEEWAHWLEGESNLIAEPKIVSGINAAADVL